MRISDWSSDVCSSDLLDIVVHVAGSLRDRMMFNMTEEEWDAVIAVHLKGAFNTFQAASKLMRPQKWGRLIAMSSDSAYGSPGQPNYAAAKAGILGLVWSTAVAMGKYGVTTNADMPNGATRMLDATAAGQEPLARSEEHTSELQSLIRFTYVLYCLKKKTKYNTTHITS